MTQKNQMYEVKRGSIKNITMQYTKYKNNAIQKDEGQNNLLKKVIKKV